MPLDTRDLEQKVKSSPTGDDSMLAREPEDVTRALARIQQCIDKAEEQRQKVVATGALSSDQEATMINGLNIHARAEIAQIWLRCTRPTSLIFWKPCLNTTVCSFGTW